MRTILRNGPLPALTLCWLSSIMALSTWAQHPPEHSAHQMPPATNTTRINPHGAETQTVEEILAGRPSAPTNLYPRKDWPIPMEDRMRHFFLLADVLEYRPDGNDSDFRWDIDSWYGGDFNRVWLKSEGEQSAKERDYDLDAQILYGRFVGKYYDFQIGVRGETRVYEGHNESRAHAVIGFEGHAPYRFDVEPALFISEEGDISARFTATRDLLLTQKLILQGRFETSVAIQEVEEFATGSGLNHIELGLRLRYEIRREFAPYIGVTYEQSFAGTADLIRREGGDPSQVRLVTGLRIWF